MAEKMIALPAVRGMCMDVAPITIDRWMKTRGFPKPARVGGRRFWRESDVVAWLAAQGVEVAA